jgi:hypothetical protein
MSVRTNISFFLFSIFFNALCFGEDFSKDNDKAKSIYSPLAAKDRALYREVTTILEKDPDLKRTLLD